MPLFLKKINNLLHKACKVDHSSYFVTTLNRTREKKSKRKQKRKGKKEEKKILKNPKKIVKATSLYNTLSKRKGI